MLYKLFHCSDESIYNSPALRKRVLQIFSLDEIKNNTSESNIGGESYTTVSKYQFSIPMNPHARILYSWITKQINSCVDFFPSKKGKLSIVHSWMNMMNKGTQVEVHNHKSVDKSLSGVAIFYYQVPHPSARFLIIKDGENHKTYKDYDTSAITPIDVKTGDLLIHHSDTFHAVEEYQGEDPRISFIFNFKFI